MFVWDLARQQALLVPEVLGTGSAENACSVAGVVDSSILCAVCAFSSPSSFLNLPYWAYLKQKKEKQIYTIIYNSIEQNILALKMAHSLLGFFRMVLEA